MLANCTEVPGNLANLPAEFTETLGNRKYRGSPKWSEAHMKEALELVRKGELSYRAASQRFNIPFQSIYYRMKLEKEGMEVAQLGS